MNRKLAREIIRFLRVSGDPEISLTHLQSLGTREWARTLVWLDQSGLALYFWQRLKERRAEGSLPPQVQARLAQNLADNRRRIADMAEEFRLLNRRFDDAGVTYAVLKGFTLIPDYCPDASFRTSYDYDYLLCAESLERARQALGAAGYLRQDVGEDHTLVYFESSCPPRPPSRGDDLYSGQLRRTVELHVRLWEADREKIRIEPLEDPLTRRAWRTWEGLRFPALADEDALVFQALHAFRHILHNWCRLSVLLEIAYLLEQHSSDSTFWDRFRDRVQGRAMLSEAVGVVFTLAAGLFDVEIPAGVSVCITSNLKPAAALWVERYGLNSAVDNFSGNKFSLFLHREFIRDPPAWRAIRRRRLFPFRRPHRAVQASNPRLSAQVVAGWKQSLHILGRLSFHLNALVRYAREFPRWEQALREDRANRVLRTQRQSRSLASAVSRFPGDQ